jgi:hypothetical protein
MRATYNEINTIWTLEIVDPNHNYDAVVLVLALPHHQLGAITDAEHEKVAKMSQLGNSPTAILTALRHVNPNSCLVPCDIYNLLYKLRLDELASSTPVEWLLMVRRFYSSIPFKLLTNFNRNSKRWASNQRHTQI